MLNKRSIDASDVDLTDLPSHLRPQQSKPKGEVAEQKGSSSNSVSTPGVNC